MFRDHKPADSTHLTTNDNTSFQPTGIKMATENMAMTRANLIRALLKTDIAIVYVLSYITQK